MTSNGEVGKLPDKSSPTLYLTQPTEGERLATWKLTQQTWGGALSPEGYLERETHLMTVPLAKNDGITHWILVEKGATPDERPIYASCESLRKPSVMSDKNGKIIDVLAHGIGSVFCNPLYRGKGYASRMMSELAKVLRTWQNSEHIKTAFSVLWSDIGPKYYAGHGWLAFPSNHVEFPPVSGPSLSTARRLSISDLEELCAIDESLIRRFMSGGHGGKTKVAILPNSDHMAWHHMREDFLCNKLFDKTPTIRGAIVGEKGHRMWAVWTRSFYGTLKPESGNILHILRLVIEDEASACNLTSKTNQTSLDNLSMAKHTQHLKSIIQVAQAEAAEWQLNHVELWNTSHLVRNIVDHIDLKHSRVHRDTESISSLLWYGTGNGGEDELEWVGNEKYGWC